MDEKKQDQVRVLKVIEYSGDREAVELHLAQGWVQHGSERRMVVHSKVGTYPPIQTHPSYPTAEYLGVCTIRGSILGYLPELLMPLTPEPGLAEPLATEPEVAEPHAVETAPVDYTALHASRDTAPFDQSRHIASVEYETPPPAPSVDRVPMNPGELPEAEPTFTNEHGTFKVGDLYLYNGQTASVYLITKIAGTRLWSVVLGDDERPPFSPEWFAKLASQATEDHFDWQRRMMPYVVPQP